MLIKFHTQLDGLSQHLRKPVQNRFLQAILVITCQIIPSLAKRAGITKYSRSYQYRLDELRFIA